MSISVLDLKPGDRVILNCPKARMQTHREAQFEGIFLTMKDAIADRTKTGVVNILEQRAPETEAFHANAEGRRFARFLLQSTSDPNAVLRTAGGDVLRLPPDHVPGALVELVCAFHVEADGCLREGEGRRIFVERRVRMGHG